VASGVDVGADVTVGAVVAGVVGLGTGGDCVGRTQ